MGEEAEIQRFQKNIVLIRKLAGWTAEEFANKVGITRQTMSNIENNKSKLSKTQYIAMRFVLKELIAYPYANMDRKKNKKEEGVDDILAWVLEMIVDNPQNYSDNDREIVLRKANAFASAIINNTSTREEASKDFLDILKVAGITVGAIVIGIIGFKGIKKL
ncbi:MAG: helix-turn-helix transcriptional regulator [Clostridia bacterium]|nr:helix-turn-helix transcriptional regulator [Clostridia bacterium]